MLAFVGLDWQLLYFPPRCSGVQRLRCNASWQPKGQLKNCTIWQAFGLRGEVSSPRQDIVYLTLIENPSSWSLSPSCYNYRCFTPAREGLVFEEVTRTRPELLVTYWRLLPLHKKKSCVKDILHVNAMKNMVKDATCFKGISPSSIDVVLFLCLQSASGFFLYWHRAERLPKKGCVLREINNSTTETKKNLLSQLQTFQRAFNDLTNAPLHKCEIFDVDDAYWFVENVLSSVIDKHAHL